MTSIEKMAIVPYMSRRLYLRPQKLRLNSRSAGSLSFVPPVATCSSRWPVQILYSSVSYWFDITNLLPGGWATCRPLAASGTTSRSECSPLIVCSFIPLESFAYDGSRTDPRTDRLGSSLREDHFYTLRRERKDGKWNKGTAQFSLLLYLPR